MAKIEEKKPVVAEISEVIKDAEKKMSRRHKRRRRSLPAIQAVFIRESEGDFIVMVEMFIATVISAIKKHLCYNYFNI